MQTPTTHIKRSNVNGKNKKNIRKRIEEEDIQKITTQSVARAMKERKKE